jgi:hypothetical protein
VGSDDGLERRRDGTRSPQFAVSDGEVHVRGRATIGVRREDPGPMPIYELERPQCKHRFEELVGGASQ